ncbi:MAG TPA: hypothetical protein VMU28_01290 [Terriglobales bacterium]|nr:hypothetical protein [Terriglobales bacterium]
MISFRTFRRTSVLLLFLLSAPLLVSAAKKASNEKVIDSGTFVVMIKGNKVASEKFEIVQTADMSIARSELRVNDNKEQRAEYQLAPNGTLIRYQWKEEGKGEAVVEPKDEFLVEHVSLSDSGKKAEQPFVLPTSTLIMDDGFFSQRELLLWRYLAASCQLKPGETGCRLPSQQYGVIIPRQQTSMQVTIEYKGSQKLTLKGTEMDLQRFQLSSEGFNWTIWIDAQYKIQKIAIDDENTEIYRE